MIMNKRDYFDYLEQDRIALGYQDRKKPRPYSDEIWKFQRQLRKLEYLSNCSSGLAGKIRIALTKIRFKRMSMQLGFSIPINVFGPGLSIAHYGTIVVNGKARVGKNCRVQTCVVVGGKYGCGSYPVLGDNCYIGSGAKIIGDVKLGDNVVVGANAVVTKNFGNDVTLVGCPAHPLGR